MAGRTSTHRSSRGAAIANVIGTVGTSMILIRSLIRANSARRFNAHVVVFFIFLVLNIGGILTPLGNGPLFLGYLQGIDFFWTTRALWSAAVFTIAVVLLIFFLVDSYFYRQEASAQPAIAEASKLRVRGVVNVALIGIVVLAIVASGVWHPGIGFHVLGTRIELQNLVCELVMVLVALASLRLTNPSLHAANGFEWEPIREVAYLRRYSRYHHSPDSDASRRRERSIFGGDQFAFTYRWNAGQRRLFLGNGIAFVPSSTMRQPLRSFGPHGSAREDIDPDFARRGVHDWQCAEFHGLCHRAARRRENAWLLPLYDLVGRNSTSLFAVITWLFVM
jgi:Putative citrate transport